MKSFTEYLTEDADAKITREAFIYLPPKEPVDQFAQCGTCTQFGSENQRCQALGPNDVVKAGWSCGLYTHGTPQKKVIPLKSCTPKEAGLFKKQVRCENCKWFTGSNSTCELYKKLNELPMFDLDTKVEAKACCNAWT